MQVTGIAAAHLGALFDDVLAGRGLRTVYQPIIDLRRRTVAGYEALTRFDHRDAGCGTERVFEAAAELGLAAELDARALRSALHRRPDLPVNCFMTVNVEPSSLLSAAVRTELAAAGSLAGVVVEITERRPWDPQEIEPALNWLRGAGALIAIDDAGSGYAGLQQILALRPSILKVDRALIQGIDDDEAKVAVVEMLGVFASRIDAWVLAEGVETLAEAQRLISLCIPLAQGYFFARPSEPWALIDPSVHAAMRSFDRTPSTSLHRMLTVMPSVRDDDPSVSMQFAVSSARWMVVVDANQRALGLVTPDSAMVGEVMSATQANVDSTPAEVAQRVSTGHADPSAPVIVSDNAGRYLGVVSVRRLLAELAAPNVGL